MIISLNNIDIYYLTILENVTRKKHMKEEFKDYSLKEVNPVSYTNINGNFTNACKKLKSGITGFLRIIDQACQEMKNDFRPFMILEDDVKKMRVFPSIIEIPNNSDICYIGLSTWGMTNNKIHGIENSVCYTNINENVIRVYNMLSTHGFIVTSLRGLLTLQKCLLEDYNLNRGWDMCLAQSQPFINAYALKNPLVYQYKDIGGQEKPTKITYTSLNEKVLPEHWINNSNISNITMYKPIMK